MGDRKEGRSWFLIFCFLCMAGGYAVTVILLLLAPFLSDSPVAWTGVPAGLVLIWVGRGIATGKWLR
jgi:hypothetical protein